MRVAIFLIGIAILSISAQRGMAYGLCSEPIKPSCVGMLGITNDQFSFDMCRSEIERYRSNVISFLNCMNEEIEDTANEQKRNLNRIIEEFNCYARGGSIC